MPPENDDSNNENVDDEHPLDAEGIVMSGGQPLLLRSSSSGINHDDDDDDDEESPLAVDIVTENTNGRIIASSSTEQIPEGIVAMAPTSSSDSLDPVNNTTQSLLHGESSLHYPSSREIDQVSSTLPRLPPPLETAAVEETAGTGAESDDKHSVQDSPEAAVSVMRETTEGEEEEEEKREIEQEEKEEEIPPTFAVIPSDFSTPTEQATVLGEPATLFQDDDDYNILDPWRRQLAAATAEDYDAELTAMKRMAATSSAPAAATYGGGGGGDFQCITTTANTTNAAAASAIMNNDGTNSLEPLDGEDALAFYKRNRNFWTINAAEFLVSQEEAAHVSVARLKAQGMTLAKDYFDAAKREQRAAARVLAVAAAINTASRKDQQSSCSSNDATTAGSGTHFELGPLVGETVESFSLRTHHFWTMQAAQSLALQDATAAPVCIDALNLESARLAQEYWAISQNQVLEHHHRHVITTDSTQQATIVEITDELDLHPLEMSHDAVRAEFVGQDYSRSGTNITSLGTESSTQTALAVHGLAVDMGASTHVDDMTTEATVIDSAPLAKEESQEAWREAEEAHVLEERESSTPFLDDRKPAAVERAALDDHTEEFAVAEQEAEVLAIQEDIHPFEFIGEHEAQAHVVGQDYSYESSSAVIADEHVSPPTRDNVIAATATPEEGQGTEFHAVASPASYNDNVQATEVHAVASPASRHGQNQAIDAQAVVSPATTDPRSLSTAQEQTREVHAVVVEQAPPTPRATPVATVSNPFEDDPNDTPAMSRDGLAALDAQYDDSWMRAPSLASQDLPPVAVLAPSDQSAWCLEDVSDNTHGDDCRGTLPPRSSSADVDENFDEFLRTSSGSSEPTHSNRRNQLHNVSCLPT
jgi:hypothetical protein